MKKTISKVILIFVLLISMILPTFAHSGRTDSNGGHYDKSTGTYHYHNSGTSSSTSQTTTQSTTQAPTTNTVVEPATKPTTETTTQTTTQPQTEAPKKVINKYYVEFPTVPNFGYVADIEPFYTYRENGVYVYRYDGAGMDSKIATKVGEQWGKMLVEAGFFDSKQIENGITMRGNNLLIIFVADNDDIISITIITLPKSEKSDKKVGDKLGNVLNTDIKTYINGERIPCYNINNKSVVLISDLKNYGFDVIYDDKTRTTTLIRNFDKIFTPIQNISNNTEKAGTISSDYVYTDIVAIVNGKKVESFNAKGNLAIYFSSLGDYGTFQWDSATNSSKLTLNKK